MVRLSSVTLPSPTVVGPAGANFVCLTGVPILFRFIRAPEPGSVIGSLITLFGGSIQLVQTQPALTSGPSLAAVENNVVTLCGNLRQVGGQLVLDVRSVIPFFFNPFFSTLA